jgi:hypothetical protein
VGQSPNEPIVSSARRVFLQRFLQLNLHITDLFIKDRDQIAYHTTVARRICVEKGRADLPGFDAIAKKFPGQHIVTIERIFERVRRKLRSVAAAN